jgi:hypothetical protein
MKSKKNVAHLSIYRTSQPLYPNAADANYFAGKLLDIVTAVVSSMGFITAMICLVILN